jgi:HME family heavy-metal exporter
MSFAVWVRASLQHRGAVLLLAVLLLGFGTWQAQRLQLDVLPDLTRPSVSVHVELPALSAQDAADQASRPLEQALGGLPGLVRLRSTSVAGLALLQAEFSWDADPYRSRQLVSERVDSVRARLPRGSEPRLGPITSLMGEILLVALSGPDETAAMRALRSHADWVLRPALLGVPGVAQITVIGGEVAQWEVQPDPARMKLFGVDLVQLESALKGYGENRGAGIGTLEGRERSIRGIATPFDAADLGRVAIAHRDSGSVRLKQIATVAEGAPQRRGSAGHNGGPAVILAIQKQPGTDTLAVTDAAEAQLASLDAQLPAGVTRATVFRQADFIRSAVGNVRDALLHGGLIVALVLALFLSGGRATLISVLAIPLSIAGAVLVLGLMGQSINSLTLGGLAIAVGELVDDAVVGVENVARRLRESTEATLHTVAQATLEVRSGILLATLLIIAGFAPLFALGGVEGRLFAALALAYVAAIVASLVVAATVTPALCALGFTGGRARLPRERVWLGRLQERYSNWLDAGLRQPRRLVAACTALLVLSAVMAWLLPRSFLPPLNEGTLTVNLVLTPGLALDESERVGRAAERLILEIPEVASVARRTGRAELDEHAEGVHYSELDVRLKAQDRSRDDIISDLAARLDVLPGIVSVSQPISHRIDHLLSGVRAPLAVKLYGENPEDTARLLADVRAQIRKVPRLHEAGLDISTEVDELRIRTDTERAALYGASPPAVLEHLSGLVGGRLLSHIVQAPRQFDLVLRLPEAQRRPQVLGQLPVDTPAGQVPLGWIANLETARVPDRILRENGRRRLALALFADHGDVSRAAAELESRLASIHVPPGTELRLEGQATERQRTTRQLLLLGGLALLGMAALLHARFHSYPQVLIVLASLPLAWIGGVVALALTWTPLSLASLVGFIALTGIAARNSILKIGRYRDLASVENAGTLRERILRGSRERLTPVLMTSLVAALSLLPLLFGAQAPGKEILHPVALVIFGGLFSSTLLDSFVTPLLFLHFGDRRNGAS